MSIARTNILKDGSLTHITFRCLNREFFFKPSEVKNYILKIWTKYKAKYKLKIYEFIIMDNHAHLLVMVESVEKLGNFMRITNSLIAKFINKYFHRDSHALKERYKSPLVSDFSYVLATMQYIWLNRFKVNKSEPTTDPYCSFYYRINELKNKLLDNLEELHITEKNLIKWMVDLLNAAKGVLFSQEIFEHQHTIGSKEEIKSRNFILCKKDKKARC